MKTIESSIKLIISIAMITSTVTAFAKNPAPSIKEENITFMDGTTKMNGFVAYDENVKGKRPAILVIPEWWGLNDYPKMRARKLAELGYIAMAVDVFGDGKIAANPTDAQNFTMPFYKDPSLGKKRLDAALIKIKELPQTDPSKVAAIGYCFGGFIVLNSAKLGTDLKGVVSFHGGLGGVPVDKKLLRAKVLICQGASDKFVSIKDADKLKFQLDSIGADNTLKVYPDATHSFTNPAATRIGKEFNMPVEYNAEADAASWNDMKSFLTRIFNN